MESSDLSACNVVVCEDSVTNVMILSKLLENEGIDNVQSFTDPRQILPYIVSNKCDVDLLLLDIEMPHMSGFDVMQALQSEFGHLAFPILIVTGLDDKNTLHRALLSGASDFVTKPFDQVEVLLRVRNLLRAHLALKMKTRLALQLESDVERRTAELDRANDMLVRLLALAGEMRDGETAQHVARVGRYSRIMAEAIELPAELCFMLERAAPLHDIGKIGIPDSILLKKGELDANERKIMNSHTTKGLQLLGESGHDSILIQMAASIAWCHHEKWDGSGYPRGLKGESIPIEARITTVSDVFDAMTTRRPYKEAYPVEEAVAFLHENAGRQFDPALVAVFVANLDRIVATMNELRDEEVAAAGF